VVGVVAVVVVVGAAVVVVVGFAVVVVVSLDVVVVVVWLYRLKKLAKSKYVKPLVAANELLPAAASIKLHIADRRILRFKINHS
jgi:hypothetical protein